MQLTEPEKESREIVILMVENPETPTETTLKSPTETWTVS
jgi:hypothetical protein